MMAADGKGLRIALTAAEGGLVVEALAELPFKTVFELIGELNRQANLQGDAGGHEFALYPAQLALIVKALGELPYARVHVLMAALHAQVAEQE